MGRFSHEWVHCRHPHPSGPMVKCGNLLLFSFRDNLVFVEERRREGEGKREREREAKGEIDIDIDHFNREETIGKRENGRRKREQCWVMTPLG